jgi:Rieske Fe-S protein
VAARRSVLGWLGGAVATGLGLALAVPAAALLTFPTRRRTVGGADQPVDVGPLERVPPETPLRVSLRAPSLRDAWTRFADVTLGAAWLVRDGERVRALSTVCPHAGCAVDWQPEARQFRCPCHDSVFDARGERDSGPSPRGMDELPCEVAGGRVRVAWRRFRQGVPAKEEA